MEQPPDFLSHFLGRVSGRLSAVLAALTGKASRLRACIDRKLEGPIGQELDKRLGGRWAELKDRLLSGALLATLALLVIWLGGWLFIAVVVAAGLHMLREWDGLTADMDATHLQRWKLAGIAYVAIPCASLIWLREIGASPVIFIILTVCATDIGAYFIGREIGGPKLAPAISPGKTWAGLGGGMVAAALIATICTGFAPYPATAPAAFMLGAILAVIAQGGDLFESWLKRRAGVKDSGQLLPGHGGLLDRVDGLVTAVPFYSLLLWVIGYLL